MAIALLDADGSILWWDRQHEAVPEGLDPRGTKTWDWQPAAAKQQGEMLFALAMLRGVAGPQKMPVEIDGKTFIHDVTYLKLRSEVVCIWHEGADTVLPPRELEALLLICQGCKNREIAQRMNIAATTVETYKTLLAERLGVRDTAGMVRWAIRAGIICP